MTSRRRLLAAAPFPLPGEHAAGYLRRLAIANGFTTLRQLRSATGIGALSPISGSATWNRLDEITGIGEERLEPLRWRHLANDVDLRWIMMNGTPIRLRDLDLVHMRHCTDCLAKDHILRAIWSIRLVTACTMHRTRLIDGCQACGRVTVLDERMPLAACATCGTPVGGVKSAEADADELLVAHAIKAALGRNHIETRQGWPDWLSTLAPGTAIAALDRLAAIDRLSRLPHTTAPAPKQAPHLAYARQDAKAAGKMIRAWPYHLAAAVPGMMSGPASNEDEQRSGVAAAFDTPAGRLAIAPIIDHAGRRIDVVAGPVIDLANARSGVMPRARAPGTSARRPDKRACGPILSHAAAMLRLEGRSDEKRIVWWLAAGILSEALGSNGNAVLPLASIVRAERRLRRRQSANPASAECDLSWIDRSVTARSAYRKNDFLKDVFGGRIPYRRVDDGRGLAGLRFDLAAIERLAGIAKLLDWKARDHHTSLSVFNSVARAVWGSAAELDMAACDAFAAAGGTTPRQYDPPTPGARPQKRWLTADLAILVTILMDGGSVLEE